MHQTTLQWRKNSTKSSPNNRHLTADVPNCIWYTRGAIERETSMVVHTRSKPLSCTHVTDQDIFRNFMARNFNMDNVPQRRYVAKPTYLSEKSEFFVRFSFLFFITYASNGHMDRAEIPFSSIFARKRSTKFWTRATHHQTTFPGFLSFSTSLSLLLRREESSRKRWKRGLQRNRRYFKLFYTQSGACLTQWLVKKGTLTLQVDVQLTTSLQRLPLCNC